MASKAYEVAFKLGAKMDKTYGSTFQKAEEIANRTVNKLVKTAAAIGGVVLSGAAVKDSIDKAIGFESAMADVAKVVDGLKDSAGNATEAYAVMSEEILDMTARLPMAGEDITKLIAAAGQSGVAANELTRFAEEAAKMGVAFDLPAEKAGELAASIRSSVGLTQDEFVTLADKINYFGNTTTQTSDKLIEVVEATGLIGKQAGVTTDQIAAMGAAMTGMDAANMGTALSNIYSSLMTGSGATKAASEAWKSLGFTSEQVAKDMLSDSEGTMTKIFEAMNKLPKDQLASTTAAIFGNNKSTKMAIASFTENLDVLKQNFQDIGDASKYAGSMEDEFAVRAATVENKLQLARNAIDRLKISVGSLALPVVAKGATLFGDAVNGIAKRIPALMEKPAGFGEGVVGFIKSNTHIDEIYESLRPKLPTIAENAKYFASNLVSGIGSFLKGASLSDSLNESMKGVKGVLEAALGEGAGGAVFAGLESSLERVSSFIENVKINAGQIALVFKDSFSALGDTVKPVISDIIGLFGDIKDDQFNALSAIFEGIKDAVLLAAPVVTDFIEAFFRSMGKIAPPIRGISRIISETVQTIVPVLVDIFGQITDNAGFVIDGVMSFVDAFIPVINNVVEAVASHLPGILPVLQRVGETAGNLVKRIGQALQILAPLFASIFNFICQNVIPVAVVVFKNLGRAVCTVVDIIANTLPVVAAVLMAVWQAIEPVLQVIMNAFQFAFGFVSGIVASAVEIIGELINNVLTVFNGVIDFVAGVFTGDWERAWQGVQDIFKGIFEGLAALIKAPLNAVISLINGAIDGINSINFTVPDWVPGMGGQNFGVNIPRMPMLATGSNYSPDTFIAGERGPELITNAAGSKVFTALETGNIFSSLSRLQSTFSERFGNIFGTDDEESTEGKGLFRFGQIANVYNEAPVTLHVNYEININGGSVDSNSKRLITEAVKDSTKAIEEVVENVLRKHKNREVRLANG